MYLKWLWQQLLLLYFKTQRAEFYRDLADMFRRNEALMAFLEGEISNCKRTGERARGTALRLILWRHQQGHHASRLSHLLGGVMPKGDGMMLIGVDHADHKPQALLALADAVDKQMTMKKVVLAYAVLPVIMAPLCYALIVLLGRVILSIDRASPEIIKAALWSGMNGWAKFTAELTQTYGPYLLVALAALAVLATYSLPRWRGPVRLWADSWPIYSLYRDFQSGLLFTSMAMLLTNGATLRGSLEDIARRSSPWMRWHLVRVLHSLDDHPNDTLAAFSRGILSKHILARAATLLRTADTFSDVLVELGTREETRVLARVKRAAVLANLSIVGLLVALASFMGLSAISVPGKFATLVEPASMMMLKQQHEARLQAALSARSAATVNRPQGTP